MRMIRPLRAIAAPGNRDRLWWAVQVRWLVIAGFFVLAVLARQGGLLPTLRPCVWAAVLGGLLNAVNDWCVVRWRFVRAVTALAIPGDVLLITYVMIHTGGVQSPFVMMYVVQVIATAMLVDFFVAVLSALGSAACFAMALLLRSAGLVEPATFGLAGAGDGASYQLIWALFLLYCLGLLAYVGGYVSEQLRKSEEDLAAKNQELREAIGSLENVNSELRATYEQLKSTEVQLVQSEKMRALGQFVAGIAHELNNPIAFVSANIDHLQRCVEPIERILGVYSSASIPSAERAELERQYRELRIDEFLADLPSILQDCEEGARRATEIVSALRTFSRGEQQAAWSRASIHDGLDRTVALLRHRLREGVTVERAYGEIPPVECLAGQLDQVFLNLLTNAADAVGEHGQIRIRTRLVGDPPGVAKRGVHVAVEVFDDGVGIPESLQTRIFDPFFTTKEEGRGTGLGLSVSYGIVERHGGTIVVDSSPGGGSTFTVLLPVARENEGGKENA